MLCKQLLGAWQIQVLFFWKFLEFFTSKYFQSMLVESEDVEPADTEGSLL